MAEVTEHYFSEKPGAAFKPQDTRVTIAGSQITVTTSPGIFSTLGLDKGTAVLLGYLDKNGSILGADDEGTVLDLGSGWGPIAIHAAMTRPSARVVAVDINERARFLTEENARNLELENIAVYAPDQVPAEVLFDEIRSNPPIRIGKEALHSLLDAWLPRLAPAGQAYLVVAKNLGAQSLSKWIASTWTGFSVEIAHKSGGFYVIRIINSLPS